MEDEKVLIDRYAASLKSAEILISREKLRAFAYRAELLLPKAQRLLNEVDGIIANPEIENLKKLKRESVRFKQLKGILLAISSLISLFISFTRFGEFFWIYLIATILVLLVAIIMLISFIISRDGKGIIKEINSLIKTTNKIVNELLKEGIYIPFVTPIEAIGDDDASLRSALSSGRNRLLVIIGFLQALKKYKEGK
jgi:cell division protein FtsL